MYRGDKKFLKVYKAVAHSLADSFSSFEDAFYNSKGYEQTKVLDTAVTSVLSDFYLYQKELSKELSKVLDDYPELEPVIKELEFCAKYTEKFNYLHRFIKSDLEMHEVFDNMKGGI